MMEDVAILLMLAMLLMVYAQVSQDYRVRKLRREQDDINELLVSIVNEIGMAKASRSIELPKL